MAQISVVHTVNESEEEEPSVSWERVASIVAEETEKKIAPLSVVFITSKRSAALNRQYRSQSGATNVLSFPNQRDIFITPSVVRREARERQMPYTAWLTRLGVHGMLHLEGYTHDDEEDRKEMEELEKNILKKALI